MTARAPRPLRVLRLVAALPLLLAAAPALAQEQVDGEISVQRFDPAPGPRNFLTTRSARVDGHLTWSAALMANYAYQPFTVKSCQGNCDDPTLVTEIPVVENLATGDLYGSFSLFKRLQLGLKVPVTFVKGQGIDTTTGEPLEGGLSAVGLGDIQLEAKGRIWDNKLLAVGAYVYGSAPTGTMMNEGTYIGNSGPAVGGAAIGDLKLGAFTAALNVGGIYRPSMRLGPEDGEHTTYGPELRWGAAAGYEVGPIVRVVADAFGATNFSPDLGANAIEVDGAAQITPLGSPFMITVGGGVGALKGIGIPTARGFLGVLYNAETLDRDGDGIGDDVDACSDEAEDRDGFEDSDGCFDYDNDQDSLPDEVDKCADKAEDVDNFEDKDGCPEADNDKDGVEDAQDHCPAMAETVNGIDDADGCPDTKDSDSDGVPDDKDKCVDVPEDTDGFEDTDGCADPDNDKDGVLDNQDECIDEPEDGKGKGAAKKDGCPADA